MFRRCHTFVHGRNTLQLLIHFRRVISLRYTNETPKLVECLVPQIECLVITKSKSKIVFIVHLQWYKC